MKKFPNKEYYLINFPGNVENVPNSMAMLGGMNKIGEFLDNPKKNSLEIKFRPNDILSPGIKGEINPCQKLILKVTRNVKEKKVENSEICGVINEEITFPHLCDFQYVCKTVLNSSRKTKEQELNVPPPCFVGTTKPFDYNFKENPIVEIIEEKSADGGVIMKKRLRNVLQKIFSVKIIYPTGPIPTKIPDEYVRSKFENQELYNFVKKLFDERPVWSIRAVREISSKQFISPNNSLKMIIPQFSYKYKNGPFRNLLIKFGIDLLSDKKYLKYQSIDFRVPRELRKYINRDENDSKYKSSFLFSGPPKNFQIVYMVCDVCIRKVIDLVENFNCKEKCEGDYGWIKKNDYEKVILRMKEKLREWLKNKNFDSDNEIVVPKEEFYLLDKIPMKDKRKKKRKKVVRKKKSKEIIENEKKEGKKTDETKIIDLDVVMADKSKENSTDVEMVDKHEEIVEKNINKSLKNCIDDDVVMVDKPTPQKEKNNTNQL